MNIKPVATIFGILGLLASNQSYAQTTEPNRQERDCKSWVWSVMQADQHVGINSKVQGSNSEVIARMRSQKMSECDIKTVLQKKLGLLY